MLFRRSCIHGCMHGMLRAVLLGAWTAGTIHVHLKQLLNKTRR